MDAKQRSRAGAAKYTTWVGRNVQGTSVRRLVIVSGSQVFTLQCELNGAQGILFSVTTSRQAVYTNEGKCKSSTIYFGIGAECPLHGAFANADLVLHGVFLLRLCCPFKLHVGWYLVSSDKHWGGLELSRR